MKILSIAFIPFLFSSLRGAGATFAVFDLGFVEA
jgi:hypothetical protein